MNKLFDIAFPKEVIEIKEGCCGELINDDETLVCNKCFRCFPLFINVRQVYTDITPMPYVPASYMRQRINELMGKVDKDINPILDIIKDAKDTHEIYKLLKKNKLNNYYDTIYLIAKILKLPYPILSQQEEEKLIFLFNVNKCFQKKLPYHFMLSKLLEQINRQDIIPFLHAVKNKHKLKEYNILYSKT